MRPSRYRSIESTLEYDTGKYAGEFDVLGIAKSGVWHYYECKSHYTHDAYSRALKQFSRCAKAFPNREWKFIFVSSEYVGIVRLDNPWPQYVHDQLSKRKPSYN